MGVVEHRTGVYRVTLHWVPTVIVVRDQGDKGRETRPDADYVPAAEQLVGAVKDRDRWQDCARQLYAKWQTGEDPPSESALGRLGFQMREPKGDVPLAVVVANTRLADRVSELEAENARLRDRLDAGEEA